MDTVYIPPRNQVASFDVDAQNTFTPVCPDELPVEGGAEIVPELNSQAMYAQYRIGSKDAHSPKAIWVADEDHPPMSRYHGAPDVDVYWPEHAVPGTKGFELIEGLPQPREYDFFVWKGVEPDMHPYGACYHDIPRRLSTGVIEFLRAKGATTVLVGGLATDYCVKATVLELLDAGFEVVLNLAAVRGIEDNSIREALEEMGYKGVILIENSSLLHHREAT